MQSFKIAFKLRKNLSDLTKRSKLMETDSVHDGDSMVVNFPYEEDHDEVCWYKIKERM